MIRFINFPIFVHFKLYCMSYRRVCKYLCIQQLINTRIDKTNQNHYYSTFTSNRWNNLNLIIISKIVYKWYKLPFNTYKNILLVYFIIGTTVQTWFQLFRSFLCVHRRVNAILKCCSFVLCNQRFLKIYFRIV